MKQPVTIPKKPALKPAQDYYRLRREGIGFIEQMGSRDWTDYNAHDPGITMLEALCYALTDLGYRLGWDIKDLLAPSDPAVPTHQPFFTAREILTVNPWTSDDFRRLLIDLDGVRNAWVFCKECACDMPVYAVCSEEEELFLSYQKPPAGKSFSRVEPRGLYEMLLELEQDAALGDLNDRKITVNISVTDDEGTVHPVTLELRFPEPGLVTETGFQQFLDSAGPLNSVSLIRLSRSKSAPDGFFVDADEFRRNWRGVFYLKLKADFPGASIDFDQVSLRLFGSDAAKNALLQQMETAPLPVELTEALEKTDGPAMLYRDKFNLAAGQTAAAKAVLHAHRNLDEDFCSIDRVSVEDVAVCADIAVAPDADIERVQAQIWFEIERYFNPPVHFYALQELLDRGISTEDIFDGPELNNGFLLADELQAAQLRGLLRSSDIVNRIADIDGVVAVSNLLLTKYDDEGQPVTGAADNTPTHNANKMSAQWTLEVSDRRQPRLYYPMSRFLFYKNGLPFLPRTEEARATLIQLQGEAERPKIKDAANDLPAPAGVFRHPEDYYPVQYGFPLAYGIGYEGLPGHASALRRARARQMKAYLMCFEQLLVNSLAQAAHTADLFALDPTVQRTYFTRLIGEDLIRGADELFSGLTQERLDELAETEPEFLDRRNRFLDHLMARFGEQFGEYALLLHNTEGRKLAQERLIVDKIAFLKSYPLISHDRARAFNYRLDPDDAGNLSGLQWRVAKLLGYAETFFNWSGHTFSAPDQYQINFEIVDYAGVVWLSGNMNAAAPSLTEARRKTFEAVTMQMLRPESFVPAPVGSQFRIELTLPGGQASYPVLFNTLTEARAQVAGLMLSAPRSFSGNERFIIVEHLLLRPKFPGDALYPVCSDHGCAPCGDQDPYSFRLTFVMPGWADPYNNNLDMRGFADRTIRQETPAHLLPKICWVGNDGLAPDPCHPVTVEIAAILKPADPANPVACNCGRAVFELFSQVFVEWFETQKLEHCREAVWRARLEPLFASVEPPAGLSCMVTPAAWAAIVTLMLDHFTQTALYGWQFGRFEYAWKEWLRANNAIDWTELRLQERMEAALREATASMSPALSAADICAWAGMILSDYGVRFHHWMDGLLEAGKSLEEVLGQAIPQPLITSFKGFAISPGNQNIIKGKIAHFYQDPKLISASYRLWIVLDLLAKLRDVYPPATLHDCDDGSDVNPVRLNQTALGGH
ncbi:MAG: hypothetical protein L6Q97_08170 [Thermoanaerobaculia bacterium]|nr:hypothetical protein [Thermoanaerobaculia bacterium]